MSSPLDQTVRVGTVTRAEHFSAARKPELFKLWIDLGDREVQSAAQLGYHHEPAAVVDRQVLCVTGLGEVPIAGFRSEVLTLGVPGDDGNPVLVEPAERVPEGGRLY